MQAPPSLPNGAIGQLPRLGIMGSVTPAPARNPNATQALNEMPDAEGRTAFVVILFRADSVVLL